MRMICKRLVLTVAAFALLTTGTCFAQETQIASASDSGVYNLGEILIHTQADAEKTMTSVVEVTAEEIEKTGAKTVAEALDFTPGIRFSIGGRKNEGNVFLRGFRQDRFLVMLNGIPIGAPYFREVDLAMMPIDEVSKLIVTKGVSSPLHGANAMAGVLNIVTKKPVEGVSGNVAFAFGQNDEMAPSARYSSNNGKWYYSVSAKQHESDGYEISSEFTPTHPTAEDGGIRSQSDFSRTEVTTMIGKFNSKREYAFNINYVDSERGTPPPSNSTSGYKNRFTEWKKWTLDFSGEQKVSDDVMFREKLYFHKYDNTLTGYTGLDYATIATASGLTADYPDISTYDDYTFGMRILMDAFLNDATLLKTGLNFNRERHQAESSPGVVRDDFKTDNYSLAVEVEREVSQRLTVTSGIGYDIHNQVSGAERKYGTVDELVVVETAGKMGAFNPTVGLVYDADDNTTLHASMGRKTRFPTQRELYTGGGIEVHADAVNNRATSYGNQELEPEKNMMFEAGYEGRFGKNFVLGAVYFYNKTRDYINCENTGSVNNQGRPVCMYMNEQAMSSRGGEFSLSSKYKDKFSWTLAHTHTIAELSSAPDTQMSYIPKGKTDLQTERDFNGVALNVNASYLTTSVDSSNNVIKPYFLMNVGVRGEIPSLNMSWKATVDNVFDKLYWEEPGYPLAGRTMRGQLQYNF